MNDLSVQRYESLASKWMSMEDMGKAIEQLEKIYGLARNKLSEGSGNLINRARKLEKLGAKSSKPLPNSFIQNDNDEA